MRLLGCLFVFLCQSLSGQTLIDFALQDITRVIMYDMYSAPGASRAYAYICIAGYEASCVTDKHYPSLTTHLQAAPKIRRPGKTKKLDPERVAAYAMYITARSFVYSEELLLEAQQKNLGLTDTDDINFQFGNRVAEAILDWASTDGYSQTFNMDRYNPLLLPGTWEPTPPDFAPALEPYFGTVRRFITGTEFVQPLPPLPAFSVNQQDVWHTNARAVYDSSFTLTQKQQAIVFFWDDNPFEIVQKGHLQYAIKKVSPAGHWLDICRTALDSVHAGALQRSQAYALVAVAMADAVYAASDTKYAYSVLRPETYINANIDANWRPLIPSPPFPEYPSGHSCISAAAATILTQLFGPDFDFTDASETQFDLPARTFNSFAEAALEAGISRFYGGIHYLPSVEAGAQLGRQTAEHQLEVLK